jgi:hypothetical protein
VNSRERQGHDDSTRRPVVVAALHGGLCQNLQVHFCKLHVLLIGFIPTNGDRQPAGVGTRVQVTAPYKTRSMHLFIVRAQSTMSTPFFH